MKRCLSHVLSSCCLLLASSQAHAAVFSFVNQDSAGTGLNDATPFTPVGGNNATTVGAARLNVLNEAARIWGQRLISTQTIVVEAKFAAQTCTSTSGTLASAGPLFYFASAASPNVLLPAALADAMTGTNNNSRNDIGLTINSNVGTGASCLNGRTFYLGFDHNTGGNVDLLNVLLHEFGHGLGFVSLTNSDGTALVTGKFSSFEQLVYAEGIGKFWPAMTDAERASATITPGAVTINSTSINNNLSAFTTSTGLSTPGSHLRLYTPSTYSSGSSVSHWDTAASPNLLMEPFITANTTGSTDLTGCVLKDMGWNNARCPDSTGANNVAPLAAAQTLSVPRNNNTAITLTATDADSTGPLTYRIVASPTQGTLSLPTSMISSSNAGITLTFVPFSSATGTDTFTFQVSDGIDNSNLATVTLNFATNTAPVANAQSISTSAGTALIVTLTASDADGNALVYSVLTNPTNGSLSGTAPNLLYTPNVNFAGTDSFTFRVNDGALNSNTATVTVQVTPITSTVTVTSSANNESKGGGAFGWSWLIGLLGMHSARRYVRKTAH